MVFGLAIFVMGFPIFHHVCSKKESNSNSDAHRNDDDATTSEYVSSNSSAFEVKLALFNEKITRGYSSPQEVKEDLNNAACFLLNNVVK